MNNGIEIPQIMNDTEIFPAISRNDSDDNFVGTKTKLYTESIRFKWEND